jgi:hypothetical protein
MIGEFTAANLALERTAGMQRFSEPETARFPRGRSAPYR